MNLNTKVKIKLVKKSKDAITFDVTGYELSFVNALRRILLAEVPSMAIDKIELYQNTSEFHDDFLCNRLGLIPFALDADEFEFQNEDGEETDKNAVQFTFFAENPPKAQKALSIYSSSFEWRPIGEQSETHTTMEPVHKDILIVKLAPGQKIHSVLHLKKGIGRDHAKFSPVSACWYRHLATFSFSDEAMLEDEEIEALKTCFPKGHLKFGTDDDGRPTVEIVNNRFETTSQLTFMSCPSLKDKINIKIREKTVAFTVESIGTKSPDKLVRNSISILRQKFQDYRRIVKKTQKKMQKIQ